ncbi:MAG: hypothetical protein ACI4TW_05195 [Prevotella sp.]
MKQLNKIESAILVVGALLMVIGSGAYIYLKVWAPYLFAMGALAFVLMQLKQRYEGQNTTIKRLRRIMIMSDLFFLVSAVLMFASPKNCFGLDYITYLNYIHNKWVVTLLVAAILQLYSTHRISKELDKEAKKA